MVVRFHLREGGQNGRIAFLIWLLIGIVPTLASAQETEASVERGSYLVVITGCNDCHTEGYAAAKGYIPESEWLKGLALGYRGPWGTSYASNLRIGMAYLKEEAWLKYVKNVLPLKLPPMPSYNVQHMNETDLRSIHKYVISLGPAGSETPDPILPGFEPDGQYIRYPQAP